MSQFEDLPLPVSRDAQDYQRLVPANSTVEIPVVGEFVYCKFSDGSIRVVINGKSTMMESGDERRSGGATVFRGVTLINDTAVAKSIIFVIGFGRFDRKIIQGDVSITPVIRTASGETRTDSRQNLIIDIVPGLTAIQPIEKFSLITKNSDFVSAGTERIRFPSTALIVGYDDLLYCVAYVTETGQSEKYGFVGFDKNLVIQKVYVWGTTRSFTVKPADFTFSDGDIYGAFIDPNDNKTVDIKKFTRGSGFGPSLARASVTSRAKFICFNPKSREFMIHGQDGAGNYVILDKDFNEVRRGTLISDIGGSKRAISLDLATNDYLVTTNTGFAYFDPFTLLQVRESYVSPDQPTSPNSKVIQYGNVLYGVDFTGDDSFIKVAMADFERSATVKTIAPRCEFARLMTKKTNTFSTAIVTAEVVTRGLLVKGEVIKAILESYFGLVVENDYLDSVFYFDPGLSLAGFQQKPSASGGETFLSAGIVDDFSLVAPTRITLTIDDSLKFANPLAN